MRKTSIYIYIVLIFILVFDIWVQHSVIAKGFFDFWIKPYTDDFKFSVVWTILIVASMIVGFRDVLHNRESEKNELKNLLNNRMEALVLANQQLSSYRIRDILLNVFRDYVERQPYVLGVQLYKYSIKYDKKVTNVKVNLIEGHVSELCSINAALQQYYQLPICVYREFNIACKAFRLENNAKDLISFIQKFNHALSIKPIQAIDEDDASIYSLVTVGIEILEKALDFEITPFLDLNKRVLLEAKMRSGFLRAILVHESAYTFTHQAGNEKADRQYIASTVNIDNIDYLYVLVLDAEVLINPDRITMMDKLTLDFEVELNKCIKPVYNKDNLDE